MASSSTKTETSDLTESDLRRQAVAAAQKRIVEEHRDDFVRYAKEEAEKRGTTYEPRKTPTEKAQEKIAALLNDPDVDGDALRAALGA